MINASDIIPHRQATCRVYCVRKHRNIMADKEISLERKDIDLILFGDKRDLFAVQIIKTKSIGMQMFDR